MNNEGAAASSAAAAVVECDGGAEIENVAIDLDATLIDWRNALFKESVPILNFLLDLGYALYLVSHNEEGEEIVRDLGLHHYFSGFSCGQKEESPLKLVNLAELPCLKPETTVFFDDYDRIIASCREAGWTRMVKVNPHSGLSWADVEAAQFNFFKSSSGRRIAPGKYRCKANKALRAIREE